VTETVEIVEFTADAPKGCKLPSRLPPKEAGMYQLIRKMHCADKRPAHECLGRLIIDRNGITASCPRCGDARSVNPERS
jgi:hypothetical protein